MSQKSSFLQLLLILPPYMRTSFKRVVGILHSGRENLKACKSVQNLDKWASFLDFTGSDYPVLPVKEALPILMGLRGQE